jgi:hypothetical protein
MVCKIATSNPQTTAWTLDADIDSAQFTVGKGAFENEYSNQQDGNHTGSRGLPEER